jgi:hypothetical protein
MVNDANAIRNQQVGLPLSISQFLSQKEAQWHSWEKQLDENCTVFVDAIANSMASAVVKRLGEQLKDPYKVIPSPSSPLVSTFSLEMHQPHKVARLQSLAGESAQLEPFKDWFIHFGPKKTPAARVEEENFEDKKLSSSSFGSGDPQIPIAFFQNEINKIGEKIASAVKKQLSLVAAHPENSALRFKVERCSATFFSDPDTLSISTWIEGKK